MAFPAVSGSRARRACLLGVLLVAPLLLAGCTSEDAPLPHGLTLLAAYDAARSEVLRLDSSAQLAGFLARDGPGPLMAEEWLLEHAGTVPSGGAQVQSGRSDHWIILFATPQGRVLRAHVAASPFSVDVDWAGEGVDQTAQALWSMNLGGRLLVDSPAALEAARRDAAVAAHLEAHPQASLVIGATVTAVDAADARDLAYAFYWGPAGEDADAPFSFFAYVHHFTGDVVAVGDAAAHHRERVLVLVDESFTLGPVPREAQAEHTLEVRVTRAVLVLQAEGVGSFTLRVFPENGPERARIEDVVVLGPVGYEEALGTLEPGTWVLHVEVTGRLEIDLRVEGLVAVQP